jgi:hypothetical protein
MTRLGWFLLGYIAGIFAQYVLLAILSVLA